MPILDDITAGVIARIEEVAGAPVFWSLAELRQLEVEALCEATVLTGEAEQKQSGTPFTIVKNQTIHTLPSNIFALTRIEAPGGAMIRKCSIWDLDQDNKLWENDTPANMTTPATMFTEWCPLGIGAIVIHPQIVANIQVILTGIVYPILTAPPYTGAEPVNYQSEFLPAFMAYGSHAARLKEADPEFSQSMIDYEEFLADMSELSAFGYRKSELRFSRTLGSSVGVNPIEKK